MKRSQGSNGKGYFFLFAPKKRKEKKKRSFMWISTIKL